MCLLVPWSRISDPLLDSSAAPPAALSLHTRLPLGLSVLINLSVCHHDPVCLFFGHFCSSVCLLLFFHDLSVCISICLLLSFTCLSYHYNLSVCLSLISCSHLADVDVSINFHWKQIKLKVTHEKFQNLIKGRNSKRRCLHETNNYCKLKIAGFPSFASLFWFLN